MVRLKIRQKNYEEACHWLVTEKELVIEAKLKPQKHIRYFIPVLYHQAEICYQNDDYTKAKILFEEVMESAEEIRWYRVINSAQNWLADIAIELDKRDEAQQLLIKGLTVAENSKNKRRLARYQGSLARWENKWGCQEKARELATQAMNNFQYLGMTRDVERMQSLMINFD